MHRLRKIGMLTSIGLIVAALAPVAQAQQSAPVPDDRKSPNSSNAQGPQSGVVRPPDVDPEMAKKPPPVDPKMARSVPDVDPGITKPPVPVAPAGPSAQPDGNAPGVQPR